MAENTSQIQVPPTVKDKKKEVDIPNDYLTKEEREHNNFVQTRLEHARDERNSPRDEFDGMGYLEAYDRDTKSGLAFIAPVANNDENPISTGTTRQSLISLISRALSYNYSTEFTVFDKTNKELSAIGPAIGISVHHANYLDDDDDQNKERINELLTHGDVVVYEDWVREWGLEKSHPPFDGKVKGINWTERKKIIFEGCRRRTVQGRRFYFGNVFCSNINKMPFNAEVNHISYAEAKMKYGEWERWKNVPHRHNKVFDASSYAEDWKLENNEEDVEEIIYVDLPNNEMQVELNGVPMLPAGFPMRWDHGRYPWAHQGSEPIRTGFIYHRSFVRTLLNMQDLENDMWRVIVMLAWKAALPPMANNTGQIITRKQILAGQILDIDAENLKPIVDGSLQNTGFVRDVASMIRDNMTVRSVPESKQGVQPAGVNTATESIQLNKEAEIAISLNLTAAASISGKVDWLRGANLLQFAFEKGFRASALLPSRGGTVRHIVEIVDKPESSENIEASEDSIEKETGSRPKIIQLRKDVRNVIERIEARSVPKPRASSALDKIELRNMFADATTIFGPTMAREFFEGAFRSAYNVPADVRLTQEISQADLNQQQLQSKTPSQPKQPQPTAQQAVGNNLPAS